MGEGEQRLQQPAGVVVVRRTRLGAELNNFLASVSASKLVASQENFTYEEQHRQDQAAVEGRRRQQLDQAERVLRRAEGEELPLYSSLQRRQEELGDLQLEEAVGLLLPLVVLEEAVVRLKRRQVVFKSQLYSFTKLNRQTTIIRSMLTVVAVVRLKRRLVVWSMLADFFRGLLRHPGVWDRACLTVAALRRHREV